MTASEKKSFHYDLKIFGKITQTIESSLILNSETKELPSKSFSYSRIKRKSSLSENKEINLGIDPFSSSLRGFNPEASYENSILQNENVGEINVPNKKSFHFINKFTHKENESAKENDYNLKLIGVGGDLLSTNKFNMGTSITEFGGTNFNLFIFPY